MVLNLIYAADGRFAMPVAVSLSSVLRSLVSNRQIHIHIVDGGFTCAQRARVEAVAKRAATDASQEVDLAWVQPDPRWWRGVVLDFSGKHLNETVLYRLGVSSFLPEHVERAIYIDADVIAKADVSDLEAQIGPEVGLCAVQDYSMSTWGLRYRGSLEALRELGLSGDEPYFNAGILGINVSYWRQHDVAEKAACFLRDHRQIASFFDQDALNYVLRDHWKHLHPAWNFAPTCRDKLSRRGRTVEEATGHPYAQLRSEAKLIHFTGAKPWDQGYTNPERPAFVKELLTSGWFSGPTYIAWNARWYARLIVRAIEKKWTWKIKPRVTSLYRVHAKAAPAASVQSPRAREEQS